MEAPSYRRRLRHRLRHWPARRHAVLARLPLSRQRVCSSLAHASRRWHLAPPHSDRHGRRCRHQWGARSRRWDSSEAISRPSTSSTATSPTPASGPGPHAPATNSNGFRRRPPSLPHTLRADGAASSSASSPNSVADMSAPLASPCRPRRAREGACRWKSRRAAHISLTEDRQSRRSK